MVLAELEIGCAAQVVSLANVPQIARKKLMAMGILPDTEVETVRVAPMGDPIQVRVRGCDLALSKKLAAGIEVKGND